MKRKFIYSMAIAATFSVAHGIGMSKTHVVADYSFLNRAAYGVMAQNDTLVNDATVKIDKGYDVKPLSSDLQAMCQEIIDKQTTDPDESNRIFTKVYRKVRNDKDGLISVGDFFLTKKLFQVANMCATQIYKLDPTYIPGLMFAGQVAKSRGFATGNDTFFGVAGQKYDEVLALDPNNIPALHQNVLVYKKINPAAAEDFLKKIAEINPNDYNVEKDLGDIRYDASSYAEAVKYYAEYYKACPKADLNEGTIVNYVNSLFAVREYDKLKEIAQAMSEQFPKNIAFKRMIFFSDVSLGNIEAAKQSVKYVSEGEFPADYYTYLDYEFEANLAISEGNPIQAIDLYKKAISVADTASDAGRKQIVSGYKELSNLYRQENKIDEALEAYNKYVSLNGKPLGLDDHYMLGMINLSGIRLKDITDEKREAYRKAGDEHFAAVEAEKPDYYKATYRRALINMTDHTKPEPKVAELYEKVLKIAPDNEEDAVARSIRESACNYLIFYYVQKEDKANIRRVAELVLKIDPENENGKKALIFINADK